MIRFADYVVYADESGDHSLTQIDEAYPIFVLCFCIFHKKVYTRSIVPRFQSIKFKWFGHDAIVLHERDIRKQISPFNTIQNIDQFKAFMSDLNRSMDMSKFKISASVIDKRELAHDLFKDQSPYDVAMSACICQTFVWLSRRNEADSIVHFLFEKRGSKEDKDLELAFLRIVAGLNPLRARMPTFQILFVDKRANSTGMQIADLVARPIGLKTLRPHQENRAFDIIWRKIIPNLLYQKQSRSVFLFPEKRKASDFSKA